MKRRQGVLIRKPGSVTCVAFGAKGHTAETQAKLKQDEYDDESASLLQDFGFEGSFASWARELVASAGFVVSVAFMLLVGLALASMWSSTASWTCFVAARVILVLAFLSGACMLQASGPVKNCDSCDVSPYTTEDAS